MEPDARMMLLFASTENPLWKVLISNGVTENSIADYLGVARMTLTNWKRTGQIGKPPEELFGAVKGHIREALHPRSERHETRAIISKADADQASATIDAFYRLYIRDPKPHVYEAAKLLGIGVKDCQRIIDHSLYSQRPLFPQLYYIERNECEKHFRVYSGLYHAWVKRHRGKATFWFRCPMEVRYILRMKGGNVIRCKLNFPMIEQLGNLRYWEYDGFIGVRDNNIFWMFERRRDLIAGDYFHFVTDLGRNYRTKDNGCETLTMAGLYLTTDQNNARSITSGDIILQKLNADHSRDDQVAKIMHEDPAVLDQTESSDELDRFLREFELFKGPSGKRSTASEAPTGGRRTRQRTDRTHGSTVPT